MLRTIPETFRSSPKNNAEYLRLRPQLIPILRSKAQLASIAGFIDRVDLLQEMEIVALYGVSVYRDGRQSLLTWIGTMVQHTVADFLRYGSSKTRSCGVWEFEDGEWRGRRVPAASFDVQHEEDYPEALISRSAEDYWMSREADLEAQAARASFRDRADAALSGFARDLFWARINAPIELLIFSRNRTGVLPERPEQLSLYTIAKFYGVGRIRAKKAWAEVRRVVAEQSVVMEEAA